MNNICGYHSNYENKCNAFIKNKRNLIISNDKEYLGKGMYFWDNKSNAKYWYDKKMKDKTCAKCIVVKCDICIDNLLDLTDERVREFIDTMYSELVAKDELDEHRAITNNIDFLFHLFDEKFPILLWQNLWLL